MRPAPALALALALLAASAAAAPLWAEDGHRVVALVAQSLMTPSAINAATQILGGSSLVDVATWADQVKRQPGYEWSPPLHYINTPDWACNYDSVRDCADQRCVAGAIYNYTHRLTTQTDPQQVKEALMFLVHFYGDVTQPLHVGFTSDEGGNTIKGTFEGQPDSLHYVWDGPLVTMRLADNGGSDQSYANYLVSKVQSEWASNSSVTTPCQTASGTVCPDEWANESAAYACSNAYVDENGNVIKNGFVLGDDYYHHNSAIVDVQIARGGVRLAATLNALLGGGHR